MSAAGFWERRRAAVQEEAREEAAAAEKAEQEAREAALAEKEDADALAELQLPDPETLQPGDDFSAFMRSDVPERFRKVALRKLWRSNPVLANIDGLNEYDDDYRAEALGQVVKTAYQVGRGMMAHVEEMQRQAEAASDDAPAAAQTDLDNAEAEETVQGAGRNDAPGEEEVSVATVEPSSTEQAEEGAAPAPRRMRFQFEEARA